MAESAIIWHGGLMTHRKLSQGTEKQRGQAMVEFALTALLFILLLVSII
jgi:Flp pilus assembly protein TadG